MEIIFNRFPNISKAVFGELDNNALVRCKEVNQNLWSLLNNQKIQWIRMIQKQVGKVYENSESWRKVLLKAPTEIVREFAFAVHKGNYYESPLLIAAEFGSLHLWQHTVKRNGFKNCS